MAWEQTQNHTSSQIKTTRCAVKRSFLMTPIAKTTKMMRPLEMSRNSSKIISIIILTADNFNRLRKRTEETKISAQIWSSRCSIRKPLHRDRLKDRVPPNKPLKILRQTITTSVATLRWNNYWPRKVSNSRKKLKGIIRKMTVWPKWNPITSKWCAKCVLSSASSKLRRRRRMRKQKS